MPKHTFWCFCCCWSFLLVEDFLPPQNQNPSSHIYCDHFSHFPADPSLPLIYLSISISTPTYLYKFTDRIEQHQCIIYGSSLSLSLSSWVTRGRGERKEFNRLLHIWVFFSLLSPDGSQEERRFVRSLDLKERSEVRGGGRRKLCLGSHLIGTQLGPMFMSECLSCYLHEKVT